MSVKSTLELKWGTVKGWNCKTDAARDALKKWHDCGVSWGCAQQVDKPGQKQALIDAMDHFDEFWLDWDGKQVTREEAKEYIRTYGQPAPEPK